MSISTIDREHGYKEEGRKGRRTRNASEAGAVGVTRLDKLSAGGRLLGDVLALRGLGLPDGVGGVASVVVDSSSELET
jgi:hypothetical protein